MSVEKPKNEAKKEESAPESKKPETKAKNSIKLPFLGLAIVAVIIVVVAVLFIFVLHTGKAANVSSVSYTPVNLFTSTSMSSLMGGNWTLYANETANSSVISADSSSFPPGTVSAALQEFLPSSEISAIASNSTSNKSSIYYFSSEVFYLNSTASTSSVLSTVNGLVSSELSNQTALKSNTSSIGSSTLVYLTGSIKSTNTTNKVSYAYIFNGKTFIIDVMDNSNFNYSQAKELAAYPFSNSL